MPQLWEAKLEIYEGNHRAVEEMLATENSSLSFSTVVQIKNLENLRDYLEEEGDPHEQLVNVRALIKAYRKKLLLWEDGKVTYWSKGECIHGPVDFDRTFEDVKKYNEQCRGTSFWVEGLNGPGSVPQLAFNVPAWKAQAAPSGARWHHHMIYFHLRVSSLPTALAGVAVPVQARPHPQKFTFIDDTGSTLPTIFMDDAMSLQAGPMGVLGPPFLCYLQIRNYNGNMAWHETHLYEFHMQIRIAQGGLKYLRPDHKWIPQQTFVMREAYNPQIHVRLSGSWMRNIVYTATVPDNLGVLYLAGTITALRGMLPTVNVRDARTPAPFIPQGGPNATFPRPL
ncbi:Uncharacterized protein PECH_005765 [Penicillium ucsense]|uniref:Uncharacterized protein n=1 Tax=Penicillium ucsense TaxID=2839758 RepID=A0A8J8W1V7_9EURO|nr:Uncharacterized protein PECM_006218 [Penicillium ucsense]KAF7736177.1 Uncharacterized protein PECH_005765 [Penicillium ucsense]